MLRTKIVCTIGPASEDEETLRSMIQAGMDVARLNFSHGDHRAHARRIATIRRLAQEMDRATSIVQDLQGPKIRLGEIAAGSVELIPDSELILTLEPVPGSPRELHLPCPELMAQAAPGDRILLSDGEIELQLLDARKDRLLTRVVAGGKLRSRQGVNVPGIELGFPSLTVKDEKDLAFGIEQGVDYVALSFVRRAEDIQTLRQRIEEKGADIPIIAKIEKAEAVEAFDQILEVSDGIMVARGDLGVETPAAGVPILQKEIIRKSNLSAVPVITATQMLESMMERPRPTRAEASDVANAIFDGTDAVMLSGETAVGVYPIKSVETMVTIAETADRNASYTIQGDLEGRPCLSVTDAVSQASCEMARDLSAKAIVTTTASGYTARMVARFRPQTPIIAVTSREEVSRRLALVWGVETVVVRQPIDTDEVIELSVDALQEWGLASVGDILIITAGIPHGGPGRTNMIKVHVV
jgi:pyruvate kinase